MIVAIADIHGYYDKLVRLMDDLAARPDVDFTRDTFVFLGDYVDGGPESRRVLDLLMEYERTYPHWVFLRGNHEQLMLDGIANPNTPAHVGWWQLGGEATARSYPNAAVDAVHLEWCRTRPFWHQSECYYFVHAGLVPGLRPIDCRPDDLIWIRRQFIHSPHNWGKRVVYGHTFTPEPLVHPNKIGIDTMTFGEGVLTAVILDDARPDWHAFVAA